MTDRERKIADRLGQIIFNEGVSNDFLLDICQLATDALQLEKPINYAKIHGISRQGAYKKTIDILGTKRVIDNE
jgi:hypothetical protein